MTSILRSTARTAATGALTLLLVAAGLAAAEGPGTSRAAASAAAGSTGTGTSGSPGTTGSAAMVVPTDPGAPRLTGPEADAPADAAPLVGASGQVVGANFTGTVARQLDASSLWWKWTAPRSGRVTFTTHGSELDTVLTVHEGTAAAPTVLARNDDAGDVATSEVVVDATEGETYLIEVAAKSEDAGLVTLGWQSQASALPEAGLSPELGALATPTYPTIPISTNTGEKPQSKVWQHAGTWWAVLATTAVAPTGTWLWRLDGDAWSAQLLLSSATGVRADTKQVGEVTHVLLHGSSSSLVSLEYDASTGTYALWDQRPTATSVSLPGSETATIDIDTAGRMWLAYDTSSAVRVQYSDAPYTSFSSAVTLDSAITDDDIATVTAMPGGRIGVLWSDQRTQRFGFRTHTDGTSPSSWSADEVPASQSALSIGGGMADDHLNVAVASDGTLYAAVKTSYNRSNRTVIGLLVRRPDGTWDPMHEVDRKGTRPIVLLNEDAGVLHVLYTASESLDDILVKSSPRGAIDFGDPAADLLDGSYNNVTSTKENWTDRALALASSATHASHAFVTLPAPPGTPVAADGSVQTIQDQPVQGTLGVTTSSGGPLVFEVLTDPTKGTVTLDDAATGAFTYTPGSGQTGTDTFTFRVRDDQVWSDPATMTVTISPTPQPGSSTVGTWLMDEGTGTTMTDSSPAANTGTLTGTGTWVPGVSGTALRLDGTTNHVTIPDATSLDLTTALTVAAWIRPEHNATQYVVKKAAIGSTNGYELGLSSSGIPFLRLNERTSGNTYRLDATSTHPTDGQTWMHVAATYDGTTLRIYINGTLEGTKAGPTAIATNNLPLTLGAEPGGLRLYRGALDDVQLHNRALTPTEIATLAGR